MDLIGNINYFKLFILDILAEFTSGERYELRVQSINVDQLDVRRCPRLALDKLLKHIRNSTVYKQIKVEVVYSMLKEDLPTSKTSVLTCMERHLLLTVIFHYIGVSPSSSLSFIALVLTL